MMPSHHLLKSVPNNHDTGAARTAGQIGGTGWTGSTAAATAGVCDTASRADDTN
jgi:hypothetical protein